MAPTSSSKSRDVSILCFFVFPFSDYNGFKFAVVRLSYHELLQFIFLSKIPKGKQQLTSFVLSPYRVFATYFKTPNILKQLTKPLNFTESWFAFLRPIRIERFIFNSISLLPGLRFLSYKIIKKLDNLCYHCGFIFVFKFEGQKTSLEDHI